MSQQHLKWIELVKERIEKRGWSQTDLAIVVGVSPSAITQLFKDGKGSDDLKLRINKKLRISESWERFEEQGMTDRELFELPEDYVESTGLDKITFEVPFELFTKIMKGYGHKLAWEDY